MVIGLLGGRFQPFHKGHEKVINLILHYYKDNIDELRICVYSSLKPTKENPFYFEEVKRMISYSFDIPVYRIRAPCPYTITKDMFALKKKLEEENVIWFSANLQGYPIHKLFSEIAGWDVVYIQFPRIIHAEELRKMIYSGDKSYMKYVNRKGIEIIEEIFPERYEKVKDKKRGKWGFIFI